MSISARRSSASRGALVVLAATAVVGMLASCSGGTANEGPAEGQLYQLGTVLPPDSDDGRCFEEFAADASESTGLNVQTAPSGALGNEPDIYSNLAAGTFQFAGLSTSQLGAEFPKLNVLTLPFLFDDHDHAQAAFTSPEVQGLLEEFSDATGVTVLGACSSVFRDVAAKVPVRTPADVEGVTLRVPPNEISIALWESMGGIPRDVPHSEVYQALESRLVAAADYPFGSILSGKFYEATDYYSQTGHTWLAQTLVVNTEFFESLDEEKQNALREAAAAQTAKVFGIAKESLSRVTAELAEFGTVVDDVDTDAFREATASVATQFAEKYGVVDLYEKLKALGD